MLDTILNLLYPNVCGFCNKLCEKGLCKKCEMKLQKYKIKEYKNNSVISVLKYEGNIRKKIIEYKFGDKAYLYKTFAQIILNDKKICGILKSYDIIIPVPLHKNKMHIRGYNQTELIAEELATNISCLELKKNVLFKTKNTEVQSLLTKKERQENIKDAFNIRNEEIIQNKKLILFDDIYTTGATVNECRKVLKNAGAKDILVLTITKD